MNRACSIKVMPAAHNGLSVGSSPTTPTIVVNKYRHKPTSNDVYIGRGSKWGNPFVIGKDGSREEVIEKYKTHLLSNSNLIECLRELKGKTLVCFCKPKACHGDFLCEVVETLYGKCEN